MTSFNTTTIPLVALFLLIGAVGCDIETPRQDSTLLKTTLDNGRSRVRDSIIIEVQKAASRGDSVDLVRVFGDILVSDTLNLDNYINYGYILGVKGHPEQGLRYLDRALRYAPENSPILFAKAMLWAFIQVNARSRDSVYHYLKMAISKDSINSYYWTAISMIYDEDSLYSEAVGAINRAIIHEPKDTSLLFRRAGYLISLSRFDAALGDMMYIPLALRHDFIAYANRGFCFFALNNYIKAIEDLNTAIQLNPMMGRLYAIRGAAKSKISDYAGAYLDFEKGAQLKDPDCNQYFQEYREYYDDSKN